MIGEGRKRRKEEKEGRTTEGRKEGREVRKGGSNEGCV
jgi:hypothetical protein